MDSGFRRDGRRSFSYAKLSNPSKSYPYPITDENHLPMPASATTPVYSDISKFSFPRKPVYLSQPHSAMKRTNHRRNHSVDDAYSRLNGLAPSMPLSPLNGNGARTHRRRHSSVTFASRPQVINSGGVGCPSKSSKVIRFNSSGSSRMGVALGEAVSHQLRLSTPSDSTEPIIFHVGSDFALKLCVKWTDFDEMSYLIPVGFGPIYLETLARRIARACRSYIQTKAIPVQWDQVKLHSICEVSYGIWRPRLAVT